MRPRSGLTSCTCGLALAILAVAISCAPTNEQRYADRLDQTAGTPSMHGVVHQRLTYIMNSIEYDPMPDPRYEWIEQKRYKQFQDAIQTAARLSASAQYIAPMADKMGLNPQEQAQFRNLSDQLGKQAGEMSELLSDALYNTARNEARDIKVTCDQCHALMKNSKAATRPTE